MATAGMRRASSPSPSPATAAATNGTETFNWETALERDPRLPQMSKYMEQILIANFPAISEKLRREEPPARRYEPQAPPPPPPSLSKQQQQQQRQQPQARPVAAKPAAVNGSRDDAARAHQQTRSPQPRRPAHAHANELKLQWSSGDSSSEVDMREVDPMDELSDFETQPPAPPARAPAAYDRNNTKRWQTRNDDDGDDEMDGDGGGGMSDVAMDIDREDAQSDDDTTCVVCHTSENEDKILLCDGCNAEYHLYCLTPPLTSVPLDEDWFCPRCAPSTPAASSNLSGSSSVPAVTTASTGAANTSVAPSAAPTSQSQQNSSSKQPAAPSGQSTGSRPAPLAKQEPQEPPPPAISIAQTFENDAVRSNELLVHACRCEAVKCVDETFHEFCAPMKRFLRSACWASHSSKWRAYRVARATAELFAFHAMQCREPRCSVPMCDELRAEEIV